MWLFLLFLVLILYYTQESSIEGFSYAPYRHFSTFQYPFDSPWQFYQSPWLMYGQPEKLTAFAYQQNSVPNYYEKFARDFY